jgi:polysaccharide biosynthesis protein PslH
VRTLLVCRDVPYPPITGAPLRLWQQVNLLHSLGSVFVFSIGPSDAEERTPLIDEWIHINTNILHTPVLPGILRGFKLFSPTQFPGVGDFADRSLNRRLNAFINKVHPDIIVLSHWANPMPRALRGRSNVIVDSHNIESKLWSDQIASNTISSAIRRYRFARHESRLSKCAAVTWVTSDLDKELLIGMTKKEKAVSVWPNAIDLSYYSPAEMVRLEQTIAFKRSFPTLLFVGFMAYGPNHDAARRLICDILPQVRSRFPNVRALIVGKNPRPDLTSLAESQPNVFVTGTVDDVRPYLAVSDLVVVPLTVGGGTRLKLLEAFAARVAVVSTSKGAEGIAAAGSAEATIADSTQEMVREIHSLLGDSSRRATQIESAYHLVATEFSWQALRKRLPTELAAVLGSR